MEALFEFLWESFLRTVAGAVFLTIGITVVLCVALRLMGALGGDEVREDAPWLITMWWNRE